MIGEGKGSFALNEALIEWGQQIDTLETEIDELLQTRERVFQTPPIEWIKETLSQFRELLEINTNDSAPVLRELLGPVNLEAKFSDIGKPYFLASTSINAIAIAEPSLNCKSTDNSSTSFQWWVRPERIRTLAEISFQIEFRRVE